MHLPEVDWVWRYKGVDWLGMVLAVISLYYLAKHRKSGFVIGLACNACWLAFGIMTESVANILANLIYAGFNIHGWKCWEVDQSNCPSTQERKKHRNEPTSPFESKSGKMKQGVLSMKVIPTYAHGILDYIGGAALLFAPQIFGFSNLDGAPVLIPRVLGVIVLVQSLMTRYEVGLVRVLPMRVHLMNDYIASIFLALSPWLFGFANQPLNAWLPHVVVGISVFVVSLMTQKEPHLRPHLRESVDARH